MSIGEAFNELAKGKTIRRKDWAADCRLFLLMENRRMCFITSNGDVTRGYTLDCEDILSTDWEVVQ